MKYIGNFIFKVNTRKGLRDFCCFLGVQGLAQGLGVGATLSEQKHSPKGIMKR